MALIRNSIFAQLFIIVVSSFALILTANWLSELAANPSSEYGKTYHEKMRKGFLTEEEVILLKEMEKNHIADEKARDERMIGYFGTFFASLFSTSVLLFLAKYNMFIRLSAMVISSLFFCVAIIATGSVGQSLLWLVFAFTGAFMAEKIKGK